MTDGRSKSAESLALDERIRALAVAGVKSPEIAARLGLTRNQVCGRAARMKQKIGAGNAGGWETAKLGFVRFPQLGLRAPYQSGCRWIHGDPNHADSRWCGQDLASPSAPYCAEHMARAFRPRQPDLSEAA